MTNHYLFTEKYVFISIVQHKCILNITRDACARPRGGLGRIPFFLLLLLLLLLLLPRSHQLQFLITLFIKLGIKLSFPLEGIFCPLFFCKTKGLSSDTLISAIFVKFLVLFDNVKIPVRTFGIFNVLSNLLSRYIGCFGRRIKTKKTNNMFVILFYSVKT